MTSVTETYSRDDNFWQKYLKGRPHVPDSYFERIFNFHAEHGGRFDTAHDAGAGAAIHSARLAERFEKVIVTDPSEENISTAKSRLHGEPQYELKITKLEDTIDFPAKTVDLVFAASMMHFTDVDAAMRAVAHQLKPGGTFAAPLLGPSRMEDARVQESWNNLFNAGCRQAFQKFGEAMGSVLQYNACAYDNIEISEEFFEPGSQRIKLNETITDTPGGHCYWALIPPELRQKYPPVTKIAKTERIIMETDDEWSFQKDISGLREILDTFPFEYERDDMKEAWHDFQTLVGDGVISGYWVVGTILATRK